MHCTKLYRFILILPNLLFLVEGIGSKDLDNIVQQPPQQSSTLSENMKKCRCVLCGQMIIAETQEDCVKHMEQCTAFQRVHPEDGDLNPNGVYPPQEQGSSNDAASSSTMTPPQEQAVQNDNDATKDKYTTESNVEELSIKEMRQLITKCGLSYADCIEKIDLRTRAKEALRLLNEKT
mmetsp:Transcript_1297/g.1786  ORF Transcript_1297/g.1786 Transcript_1297/m.1786 type:complete len:178 (+) Transcript_1297:76-609(+)